MCIMDQMALIASETLRKTGEREHETLMGAEDLQQHGHAGLYSMCFGSVQQNLLSWHTELHQHRSRAQIQCQ